MNGDEEKVEKTDITDVENTKVKDHNLADEFYDSNISKEEELEEDLVKD